MHYDNYIIGRLIFPAGFGSVRADGIALSISLDAPQIQHGQSFAMRLGYGNYESSNAMGMSASGLVARGLLGPTSTVSVDAGVGISTGTRAMGGSAGITLGW